MRQIWSEKNKRTLMRRVWVSLAAAQEQVGLVSPEQLAELRMKVEGVDIERALEIEAEIHHDVMAELRTYAEQCPKGGAILHLGATSADITDNVDVLRMRSASVLIVRHLSELLGAFQEMIKRTAAEPIMAYTHIQPAEPTTLGYRLSVYARDLLDDLQDLIHLVSRLRGKGFKGAVGTQASYHFLLEGTGMSAERMEQLAMEQLDLPYYQITTQIYPRSQDLRIMNCLASIAASVHKFGLDLRILQSPAIGELSEMFTTNQVGSTAMPFKRNPINAENICSIARYIGTLPAVAWNNAGQNILERSLDDSANRRIVLAEAFLASSELIKRTNRLLAGLTLNKKAMARNLAVFRPFSSTQYLLTELVKKGANRQDAHEWIRQSSLEAWQVIEEGGPNPLVDILASHADIGQFFNYSEIQTLLSVEASTGTAPQRALAFADKLGLFLQNISDER